MNEIVLEILRKTYEEYGDGLFSDNLKLKAYLADLLVDYPVEKKRLLLAVNENIVKKLVSEKSDFSRCAVYSGVLVDTYALPEDVAGDIVEAFYLAINGDVYMINKEASKEDKTKTIITEVSQEVDDTVSRAWDTDVKDEEETIIHEEKETKEDNINNYSSSYPKSTKVFAWILLGIFALAVLILPMTFNNGSEDIYISQANVTVLGIDVGNTPDDVRLISDDSSMYTAVLDYCYYYDESQDEYIDMESYDEFVANEEYHVRFKFIAENGYYLDDYTTYMANAENTDCYGSENDIDLCREIRMYANSVSGVEMRSFDTVMNDERVVLNNWEVPIHVFEQTIYNCKEFSLKLEISDVMDGYPYGTWLVYLRNYSGDWNEVHNFEYEEGADSVTTVVQGYDGYPFEGFDALTLVRQSNYSSNHSYDFRAFDFVIVD